MIFCGTTCKRKINFFFKNEQLCSKTIAPNSFNAKYLIEKTIRTKPTLFFIMSYIYFHTKKSEILPPSMHFTLRERENLF